MSKRQIELARVQKAIAKNNTKLKTARQDSVLSEVRIKQCESQIDYQTLLYNDIVNKLKLEIEDAINNAKKLHDNLEDLLEEKESLHLKLKEATHFGQVKCEHCLNYFTQQGLTRHKNSCAAKPEIKIEKKHKAEVKVIKDDIEARKVALKKELAELNKKKPKPVKVVKPTPPPEQEKAIADVIIKNIVEKEE